MTCACWSTDERCPECRASLWAQLRGVAASRAHTWVAELRRAGVTRWPPGADVQAVAALRLRDLTSDRQLLEMLVDECVRCAEGEMAQPAAPAGDASACSR